MAPLLVLSIIVLVVLFLILIGIYNSLVSLKNQVERAWANIDVLLKQRFDEIPSLIEVIEQYVKYEKNILEKLVDARKHYLGARSAKDKMQASQEMSMALGGVLAIGENYPELKSNNNFSQLTQRISALEEALSDRRETYNETVTNFNTRIAQFPHVIFANILGYSAATMYQVAASEKVKPSLKMNLGV